MKMQSDFVVDEFNLDPNQKYWDKGLELFENGNSAIAAMQALWDYMPPPGALGTLAAIIGALYGDTYWAVTRMDTDSLAKDLQAALGINPADCQKAAAYAFSRWYGLLVRANMSDYGLIPHQDPVTSSPDVVVNGKTPLSVEQFIKQWNTYIYTPEPGYKNNIYGRAASVNIQVPIKKPVLRMFYSDAGFNPPPTSWIKMFTFSGEPTATMKGMQTGAIMPGARCANTDSFSFSPAGSGHYCLIAVAGTEYFANDPLAQPGNWNSYTWLKNNGAAGWHNVDVPKSLVSTLKFYNQDGSPERFLFEAHCRNVPVGTTVSLHCEDPALRYPLRSVNNTIDGRNQVVTAEAELPPHYAGELIVTFSQALPAGAAVEVRMNWVLTLGHDRYVNALTMHGDVMRGLVQGPVTLPMGSFTFIGA